LTELAWVTASNAGIALHPESRHLDVGAIAFDKSGAEH